MKNLKGTWIEKPQEILSRVSNGIDWGAERRVILRAGPHAIWWRRGFTGWVSRAQSGYYPGNLVHWNNHAPANFRYTYLIEGGRLQSNLNSSKVRDQIAKLLGKDAGPLPERIDAHLTYEWIP